MENKLPERKPNRLKNYDYSSVGAYFITICTINRRNYFWKDVTKTVGASNGRPIKERLTEYGKIVDLSINNISKIYPAVNLERYVIMPNHIHLLLRICPDEYGRPMVAPTIANVIKQMKGYATKKMGKSIWQKLYHDRIVRNKDEYDKIAKYIYENPVASRQSNPIASERKLGEPLSDL